MYAALLRSRWHIKNIRLANMQIAVSIAVFMALAVITIVTFSNARFHAEKTYWDRMGDYDIVALSSSSEQAKVLGDASSESDYSSVVYFDTDGVLVQGNEADAVATVGYGNLDSVAINYPLGVDTVTDNDAVITSELADSLAVKTGESITLGAKKYTVVSITNNFMIGDSGGNLLLLNSAESQISLEQMGVKMLFANYSHTDARVQGILDSFESSGIECINILEGINPIKQEFDKLFVLLFVLLLIVVAVAIVLIVGIMISVFDVSYPFWATLRTLGLGSKKARSMLIIESFVISAIGTTIGLIIGVFASSCICLFTDTTLQTVLPTFNLSLLLFFSVLSITTIIGQVLITKLISRDVMHANSHNGSKSDMSFRASVLVFAMGIVLVFIPVIVMNFSVSNLVSEHWYYLQLISSIFGIILATLALRVLILKGLTIIKRPALVLIGLLARANQRRVRSMSISLSLCSAVLVILLSFLVGIQSWAKSSALQELNIGSQATILNNTFAKQKLDTFSEENLLKKAGKQYFEVGNANNTPAYLVALSNDDYRAIYSMPTAHKLSGKNVFISESLSRTLKLESGDQLNLSLGTTITTVTVVEIVPNHDFHSMAVYLAEDVFSLALFGSYRECYSESINLAPINAGGAKSDNNDIDYSTVQQIQDQWAKDYSNGLDIIVSVTIAMIIILLFLLRNSIVTNIRRRLHDFAVLRSLGLSKSRFSLSIAGELVLFQAGSILLACLLAIIPSQVFIAINTQIIGISLSETNTLLIPLFVGFMLLSLLAVLIFQTIRNASSISIVEHIRQE